MEGIQICLSHANEYVYICTCWMGLGRARAGVSKGLFLPPLLSEAPGDRLCLAGGLGDSTLAWGSRNDKGGAGIHVCPPAHIVRCYNL